MRYVGPPSCGIHWLFGCIAAGDVRETTAAIAAELVERGGFERVEAAG